jgi:hypothetical protein
VINITEYQVGPGTYGVAVSADGSVWTSLVDRGALARVSPVGQASQLQLDSAQSRPLVLTQGPDGAIWFSRSDGHIGRIAADGDTTSLPVRSPTGDAWSLVVWIASPGRMIQSRAGRPAALAGWTRWYWAVPSTPRGGAATRCDSWPGARSCAARGVAPLQRPGGRGLRLAG